MNRYSVSQIRENGSDVIFNFKDITSCIDLIHKTLDESNESWNEFFSKNPTLISDNKNCLVIWSTKRYKNA